MLTLNWKFLNVEKPPLFQQRFCNLLCFISHPAPFGLWVSFFLAHTVDMVTLPTALEVFNEHELQPSDHVMDVVEVIHCLTALYERLEEERGILVNVPLCVDMTLNWLLNVFDRYPFRRPVARLDPKSMYSRTLLPTMGSQMPSGKGIIVCPRIW